MNRVALALALALLTLTACRSTDAPRKSQTPPASEVATWKSLTPEEHEVIVEQGTERAFSGEYWNHHADGTYRCRRCSLPLFDSGTKFDSGTGWPSFDDALPGAVREEPDGFRTEIVCSRCGGHLGHVFKGEGMTPKDTRHCVNSVSLSFTPAVDESQANTGNAFFAGGCFWGVEALLEARPGVNDVVSGYMGGSVDKPTYRQVTSGKTGHAEAVKVTYDPAKTTYETLARRFFEIHDPTQVGRQGPDIGDQYRSAIFVENDAQRAIIERLIGELQGRGYAVATKVHPATTFFDAEDYHQDYYARTGKAPYCHSPVDRFGDGP